MVDDHRDAGGCVSITFNTEVDALLESESKTIHTVKQAQILKHRFDAGQRTSIEIGDRVSRWGTIGNDSTIVQVDWSLPNLTTVVRNDDEYFSPWGVNSVWTESPAQDYHECQLRMQYFLLYRDGTRKQLVLTYIGQIEDVVCRIDGHLSVAELVTTFYQARTWRDNLTKEHGDDRKYLENTW